MNLLPCRARFPRQWHNFFKMKITNNAQKTTTTGKTHIFIYGMLSEFIKIRHFCVTFVRETNDADTLKQVSSTFIALDFPYRISPHKIKYKRRSIFLNVITGRTWLLEEHSFTVRLFEILRSKAKERYVIRTLSVLSGWAVLHVCL